MSAVPERPDPATNEILEALESLLSNREAELRILRRLEQALRARLADFPAAPPSSIPEAQTAPAAASPAGAAFHAAPAAPPSSAPASVPAPASAPAPSRTDALSVEAMVESALAHAFSGSLDLPAEDEPAPDPVLLILDDEGNRLGMPWERVTSIGLAGDGPGARKTYSLHQLLSGRMPEPPEPYRVTWAAPAGSVSLTCTELAGLLASSEAARRGVEIVVVPLGDELPSVLTLTDFLADLEESEEPACAVNPTAAVDETPAVPVHVERPPEPPAPPSDVEPQSGIGGPADRPGPEDRRDVDQGPPAAVEILEEDGPGEGAGPEEGASAPPEGAAVPPGSRDRELAAVRARAAGFVPSVPTALLAVRYLPARVGIARLLRSRGWSVVEAVDPSDVMARLHRARYQAVFCELAEIPNTGLLSALEETAASGTPIVGVAHRLRRAGADPLRPLGEIPCLRYPFQESEMQRICDHLQRARENAAAQAPV